MELSRVIFWDIDYEKIDWDNRARFVIQRVVTYGTKEDWEAIKKYYGLNRIKDNMLNERDLDKRTLSFLSCIFDIPKAQFRCFNEGQSAPPHSIFS